MYYFFRFLLASFFILKIGCIQSDCKAEKFEAKLKGNLQDTGYVNKMNELSFLYYSPNPQKSKAYADSALEFSQKINYKKGKAAALRNIGNFYWSQGNYPLALEFHLISVKILEGTLYYREKARSFNSLALVYRELKNYDVAIFYLYKSLHLLKRLGDNRGLGIIFNNLSSINIKQKNYDSANTNINKALEIFTSLKDTAKIALCYNNLGDLHTCLHHYGVALKCLRKAYAIHLFLNDQSRLAKNLNQIGKIYFELNKYDEASHFYLKALLFAKKIKIKEEIKNSYENLAYAHTKLGNYQRALQYFERFNELKDSLFNQNVSERVNHLQRAYELERKQAKIKLLTKEKEVQESEIKRQILIKNYFITGFIFASLITCILFKNNQLKNKLNKALFIQKDEILAQKQEVERKEELNKTKAQKRIAELKLTALRSQMNPHFIFNSLNSIQYCIINENIEEAYSYLSKFSRLLRMILETSDQTFITIKKEIEMLTLYLALESLRFDDKFTYTIDVDKAIDINLLKIPTLLIQPYVENAIWHGLLHKNHDRKLEISLSLEDKILICSIKDNGIGRKKASELKGPKTNAHKSKGMAITQDRLALISKTKKHKIKLSIIDLYDEAQNPTGTCIEIRIPDFINTLQPEKII